MKLQSNSYTNTHEPIILLTNDDGIDSPGIWAAAKELNQIGKVIIAAPSSQQSGTGRGLNGKGTDGTIRKENRVFQGQQYDVYSINATPAQIILHAILEILPHKPDLLVSGINYGENISMDITTSGTVGAALEAASHGILSLAISTETVDNIWFDYSDKVDFSVAAYFARFFGIMLLQKIMPADVLLLNVNVPRAATIQTPWHAARLSPNHYYQRFIERNGDWDSPASVSATIGILENEQPDTDIYVTKVDHHVSVTPISLDLTSRIVLDSFEASLKETG